MPSFELSLEHRQLSALSICFSFSCLKVTWCFLLHLFGTVGTTGPSDVSGSLSSENHETSKRGPPSNVQCHSGQSLRRTRHCYQFRTSSTVFVATLEPGLPMGRCSQPWGGEGRKRRKSQGILRIVLHTVTLFQNAFCFDVPPELLEIECLSYARSRGISSNTHSRWVLILSTPTNPAPVTSWELLLLFRVQHNSSGSAMPYLILAVGEPMCVNSRVMTPDFVATK